MTALFIAGLVMIVGIVLLAVRPTSGETAVDESLLALCQRRDTLEQQLAATVGDDQRGDIDPAFAGDERGQLELELLEVLEAIAAGGEAAPAPSPAQGGGLLSATILFLLLSTVGGGLYYQSQHHWWQANLNNQIEHAQPAASGGMPMLANGQPDISAMVERLATRLEQNPDDGEGWKRLGRSYWVMENHRGSLDAYNRAAQLLPDDYELIQGYAMARMAVMATEKLEIALAPAIASMVEKLRLRVEENPNEMDGYRAMAAVYVMVSKREAAAQMYDRVLQQNPTDLEMAITAAYNRFILANGELTEPVKEAYERIAMLDPDNKSVTWYRGYVGYKTEQWQQVLDHWAPLLEELPEKGVDYRQIAETVEQARQHLATKMLGDE